ncbi:unnamed protein product [Mesocestoides corti]|uniref:Uncharacterized protein n=2 Tax=Mesocestoides corti TaxID=53468 RepID=A0A0R3UPG2_MESCO|nr:unnamed protein product [Mesocestoides corti]
MSNVEFEKFCLRLEHAEASAITGNIPPPSLDGENLGATFQQELEAAQTEIPYLQTKLNDAIMRLELEGAEVCHLREVISGLNIDLDNRDTPVVIAHEAKVAAEIALQQLTDDLTILGARLQFDVSRACLLTPEATSLAESVASILKEREEKVQSAWDRMSKMSAEMAGMNDIERLEKEVQTPRLRVSLKPFFKGPFCVVSTCPLVPVQTDPAFQEQCEEQTNLSSVIIQRNIERMASELVEEDAQDADADGLASTDLSQVSSTLSPFSPPLPPPPSPPCVQSQNSKPLSARDRRRTDVPTSHASAPPVLPGPNPASFPHMPLSLSGKWKSIGVSVSGSLDGVDLRSMEKCNNENKQNSAIEERPVLASFPVKVHEHAVMRSTLEPRRRLLAFASLA